MDVLVLWDKNTWWPGQVSGKLKPNTKTTVHFPETKDIEVFEADEANRIKPAPYYLSGGPYTTNEVKKAVQAYKLFQLARETLFADSLRRGYNTVPMTIGVIYVDGDNKLETTNAVARIELTWTLEKGFAARALIAQRSKSKEAWGEITWKRNYVATDPSADKLLELIEDFKKEQLK